jgi:hypothetical protein
MLHTVLSLGLVVAALCLAATPRGAALLGSARPLLVIALAVMGVWQAYRVSSIRRAQKHRDLLNRIPKRPLGL